MSKQLTGRLRQINKLLTVSSVNAAATHNNLFTYVNELSHPIPNVEPPIVSPEEAVACIQSGKRTGLGQWRQMHIAPYVYLFCYVRFLRRTPFCRCLWSRPRKAEWKCDQVEVTMCSKGNRDRGGESRKFQCVCMCVNVFNSNYLHTNKNSDTQTHIDYRVQAIGFNWPWLVPEVDIQSAYHLFTSPWLPRRLYENPHRTEHKLTVPLYALYNFICIYMNAKMCFLFVLIKLTLVFK